MTRMQHENEGTRTRTTGRGGVPGDLDCRGALTTGVLEAAAVAASSVFSAASAHAQEGAVRSARREVTGKTAVIAGGARGINLATAEEMAKAGANVVVYDIATAQIPNVEYPMSTEGDLQAATLGIEAMSAKCMVLREVDEALRLILRESTEPPKEIRWPA